MVASQLGRNVNKEFDLLVTPHLPFAHVTTLMGCIWWRQIILLVSLNVFCPCWVTFTYQSYYVHQRSFESVPYFSSGPAPLVWWAPGFEWQRSHLCKLPALKAIAQAFVLIEPNLLSVSNVWLYHTDRPKAKVMIKSMDKMPIAKGVLTWHNVILI